MASNLKLAYWDFEATLSDEKSFCYITSRRLHNAVPAPCARFPKESGLFEQCICIFVFVIFLRKGTITHKGATRNNRDLEPADEGEDYRGGDGRRHTHLKHTTQHHTKHTPSKLTLHKRHTRLNRSATQHESTGGIRRLSTDAAVGREHRP